MKKHIYFTLYIVALNLSAIGQEHEFDFFIENEKNIAAMTLTSNTTFPCVGYGIRVSRLWNYDTVLIDIRGFKKPYPCYSSLDPAREKIFLPEVKTKIFYIKFRWEAMKGRRYEDQWKVEAKAGTYEVTPLTRIFTQYSK